LHASRSRPVLLVHGILCNHAIWRPLVARLREAGFGPIAAIDLEPLDADIERYAERAHRELMDLHRQCQGKPVSVVAHSMGGLVARALLRAAGERSLNCIVTLGSPHHGSAYARLLPLQAARQMRVGASWLAALNAQQEGTTTIPLTSLYGRDDSLVTPSSATLRGAHSVGLQDTGHFGLLRRSPAVDAVVHALEGEAVHGRAR
jgi:pimeloyl-ACP methyl ester carboxylesterase